MSHTSAIFNYTYTAFDSPLMVIIFVNVSNGYFPKYSFWVVNLSVLLFKVHVYTLAAFKNYTM